MNDSFLAHLGKLISPIFAPLGFGDWRTSVAIISGLGAKEVVVNTLNVLYGNLDVALPTVFTTVSAYAFLIFSALYTPCLAALATMRKEYGNKMMMISFIYQFALAWIAAFLVNAIGNALFATGGNSNSIIEFIIAGLIFIVAAAIIYKKTTNKSSKSCCSGCSGCPSNSSCSSEPKEEKTTN